VKLTVHEGEEPKSDGKTNDEPVEVL